MEVSPKLVIAVAERIRLTLLSDSAGRKRGQPVLTPEARDRPYITGPGGSDYVCGKCGRVLLAQMPRLFVSGALRCNGCGHYNNATKPAKYSQPPTMLDEIGKLPVPAEQYPSVELVPPCAHDNVLRELHDAFLKEWSAEQGPRPRVLYHYTSLEGLAGILRLHRLRATDVAYMNDSLELQLASSLIAASLDDAGRSASAIQRELLRRSRLDAKPTDLSRSFYVTCFCDDGDLLSQWRAYGANGGGYALGFSAYEMAWPGPCGLRRVIYDPAIQDRLVRGAIQRACDAFSTVAAHVLTAA